MKTPNGDVEPYLIGFNANIFRGKTTDGRLLNNEL